MALQDCREELLKTGFFGFDENAKDMVDDVIDRLKNDRSLYYADGSLSPTKAVEAFNDIIDHARTKNRQTAREQYLERESIAKVQNHIDTMRSEFKAQGADVSPSKIFDILMFGNNTRHSITGGKVSVETVSKTYASNYAQEFLDAFEPLLKENPGLARLLGLPENIFKDAGLAIKEIGNKALMEERRNLNLNIMRALEGTQVDDDVANKIADVISKMYKKIAFDINKIGGKINIIDNYNPHDHSATALLNAGPDEWKADIKTKLDWEKTYPAEFNRWQAENKIVGIERSSSSFGDSDAANEFLDYVYEAITSGKSIDFDARGFKPNPRITRNFERGRTLQFTDGNSYAEYANKFSTVDPVYSLLSKIRAAASTRAAYEQFGTRPEETLNALLKIAREDVKKDPNLTPKQKNTEARRLEGNVNDGTSKVGSKWHSLMGYNESPLNSTFYTISSGLRSFETLKLGTSPFSALFGDLVTGSVQTRRVSGESTSLFSTLKTIMSRFNFKDKEFVDQLGILSEDHIRAQNRFISPDSLEESKGFMNKYTSFMMRMSFLQNVTQNARAGSQLTHMSSVAKNRHLGFDELHPNFAHDLRQADISPTEWDLIRKHASKSKDGREYLLPKDTRNLTNEDIDPLLPEQFRGDKEPTLDYESIDAFSTDLSAKYKTREITDKLKVDKKLQKLDQKIVQTFSEYADLEKKHNDQFALKKENLIFDATQQENNAVEAVLQKAFRKNQTLRKRANNVHKKIDDLAKSVPDVFSKRYNRLVLDADRKKKSAVDAYIKTSAKGFVDKELILQRDALNKESLLLGSKLKNKNLPATERKALSSSLDQVKNKAKKIRDKISKEQTRLEGVVRANKQKEIKGIESKIDTETSTQIKELRNKTAQDFDAKKIQLENERQKLIETVSEADDVDIKNARYNAQETLTKRVNDLHDSTAKAFDADKRKVTSNLKELRLERNDRRKKYIASAKEVTGRMELKDAEKFKTFLEREQQKLDRWYLDKQKFREQARDSIEQKAKRYYVIGDSQAVVQQNARSKYITSGLGAKRGTIVGEVARTGFQFKEQAITTFNLLLKENRVGSQAGGLANATAYLGFLGTAFFSGYGLMTAKDIASGREPRDILSPKTWFDALAYSGGFGFLFDVLFNDNRGYGNIGSLFGPVGGDVGELTKAMYSLTNAMKPGSDTTMKDVGQEFAKAGFKVGLKNIVPRLWYTRNISDYYLLNPVEEAINPGVHRKRAKAMRDKTGQDYWTGTPYHRWF